MPLEVSFPPRSLNPNKSHGRHWGGLRKAKQLYFNEVFWSAKEALQKGWLELPTTERIGLHLQFIPPSGPGRVPDDDNIEASFKTGRDGLALALKVDDGRFVASKEVLPRSAVYPLGLTRIQLTPLD